MMKDQAIKTIRTLLPESGAITIPDIHAAVDTSMLIPQYANLDRDRLITELLSLYSISIDGFRVIEASQRRLPWINDRRASISWGFWNRYREYILQEKNYPPAVVSQLDRLTDRTLDGLFDPSLTGLLDKYGLVVGQVQSGKTSNYTALVCKAADAGFKLIIILAGTLNDLRTQTQLRIDEGFLGFDTQHERAFQNNNIWIGVGRINQSSVAHSLTSSLSDFNTAAANAMAMGFNTSDPIIAVVKKNATILKRLNAWLSAYAVQVGDRRLIRSKSLLMIDDEADHSSINTRREGVEATSINRAIRGILGLFERRGYVGYTATPFANIFIPIEEDQLFPRDFIVNIPPPSNYVGPDRVFGFKPVPEGETRSNTLPIVHRINDFANFVPSNHKKDHRLPTEAPESLKQAIRCFIITCAVRRLRGQVNVHNSMLIHVTRFVRWQVHIKDEIVQPIFDFYRRGIEFNIPEIIEEFRRTFEDDAPGYMSYVTTSESILKSGLATLDPSTQVHAWTDVAENLHEAAARIQVRGLNGTSADVLNYFDHQNGLSVIAIGGDKLSRGLTLEGLSVSYYLRASRMYDTLMQMGRWFGYRPGYVDLCRLFTSADLNEWFCHITLASEELRAEFEYMSDRAGSTPEQYALRVRTHPGVLQISASNKIRNATEVKVSWSGRLVESYELSKDPEIVSRNLNATKQLIDSIGEPDETPDSYRPQGGSRCFLWRDAQFSHIKDFFTKFQVHDNLRSAAPANLLRFMEIKNAQNEFAGWNVGIITKTAGEPFRINDYVSVNKVFRSQTKDSDGKDFYYIRNSRITSPTDEHIDLLPDEYDKAMAATRRLWIEDEKKGEPSYPNGSYVRNNIRKRMRKPLLLIYFLDPAGAKITDSSDPIIGFAISFPGTDRNDEVSYVIHEQLRLSFMQDDYMEDDGDESDEEHGR